jgi:hypothetical protein
MAEKVRQVQVQKTEKFSGKICELLAELKD